MGLLEGKAAFVTGGASGIGRAAAIRFASEGARVAIADSNFEDAQAACADIDKMGVEAIAIPCDVAEAVSVHDAVEAAAGKLDGIDIVFANAGINGVWTPIEELQPADWDQTIAINLRGTYLTVHYAVPYLIRAGAGSIIITSSVNGTRTFSNPGASAYSTSKAGQVAFMKMAALELGRKNIRVNAICPGAIHTNIGQSTEQVDVDKIGIEVELP